MPTSDIREQVLNALSQTGRHEWLSETHDLNELQFVPFKGTSMLPSLKDGDILIVLPLGGHFPEKGDIILAQKGEKAFLAHRVLRFDRITALVRTRGDSRLLRDGLWNLMYSRGRVVGIWRDNKILDVAPPPPWKRRYRTIALLVFSAALRRLRGHLQISQMLQK